MSSRVRNTFRRTSKYKYKGRKTYRRTMKSKGNMFDPQRMYQHKLTYRQKEGHVLQPKIQNLSEPDQRLDKATLKKYYDILLSHNMIPRNFRVLTKVIEVNPGTSLSRSIDSDSVKMWLHDDFNLGDDYSCFLINEIDIERVNVTEDNTFTGQDAYFAQWVLHTQFLCEYTYY